VILWLAVALLAFLAEAIGDVASVHYQTSVRKLRRWGAARWAIMLALLSWVDLSGIAVGLPLSALICGSVAGSAAGTWLAVTRQQIKARLKRKRKADRLD